MVNTPSDKNETFHLRTVIGYTINVQVGGKSSGDVYAMRGLWVHNHYTEQPRATVR